MKKNIYQMIPYRYEPAHKGAPYYAYGHWMNHGELCELALKAIKGYEPVKDPSTAFDKGSDIAETMTSVKSRGFTLCGLVKGDNLEDILAEYFKRVHSTNWSFVVILDEDLIEYNMDAEEFGAFAREFCKVNSRKVARAGSGTAGMVKWLERRARA